MGKASVTIEIDGKDIELLEAAIIRLSGSGFGFGSAGLQVNTLGGLWEVTDGMRELVARMREAIYKGIVNGIPAPRI